MSTRDKVIAKLIQIGVEPTDSRVQVCYENEVATSISFHRGGDSGILERYIDSSGHLSITYNDLRSL